jgi:hypothetical protein
MNYKVGDKVRVKISYSHLENQTGEIIEKSTGPGYDYRVHFGVKKYPMWFNENELELIQE